MAERLRAVRRRKIMENAKSRMERLCKLQQGFSCETGEGEGERRKAVGSLKVTESRQEEEHRRDPSPVEGKGRFLLASNVCAYFLLPDPPDELVAPQLPRRPLQPVTPSVLPPPSLMSRWIAVLCHLVHVRLLVAMLAGTVCTSQLRSHHGQYFSHAGITVSLTYVAMGYNIPCLLCLVTSELCFLLCTLISAVMTGDSPPPSQSTGTLAMLKVAIGILYPPAAVMVEQLQQVMTVAGIVCQDLCVAVFSLVTVTVLLSTFITL